MKPRTPLRWATTGSCFVRHRCTAFREHATVVTPHAAPAPRRPHNTLPRRCSAHTFRYGNVQMRVPDLGVTHSFYADKLAFAVLSREPGWLQLSAPGGLMLGFGEDKTPADQRPAPSGWRLGVSTSSLGGCARGGCGMHRCVPGPCRGTCVSDLGVVPAAAHVARASQPPPVTRWRKRG